MTTWNHKTNPAGAQVSHNGQNYITRIEHDATIVYDSRDTRETVDVSSMNSWLDQVDQFENNTQVDQLENITQVDQLEDITILSVTSFTPSQEVESTHVFVAKAMSEANEVLDTDITTFNIPTPTPSSLT